MYGWSACHSPAPKIHCLILIVTIIRSGRPDDKTFPHPCLLIGSHCLSHQIEQIDTTRARAIRTMTLNDATQPIAKSSCHSIKKKNITSPKAHGIPLIIVNCSLKKILITHTWPRKMIFFETGSNVFFFGKSYLRSKNESFQAKNRVDYLVSHSGRDLFNDSLNG